MPTDSSAAKAWSDVISSSKHFVYIEQQYFITSFDEESDSDEELDYKGASVLNVAAPPSLKPGQTVEVPHGATTMTAVVDDFGRLRAVDSTQPSSQGLLQRVGSKIGDVMDGIDSRKGSFEKGVKNNIGRALLERLRRAIRGDEAFRALDITAIAAEGSIAGR